MKPTGPKFDSVDLEAAFFANENARLLDEMRKKSAHDDRRELLRQVVRIDDEGFLDRLIGLGIGPETAMALRLIPLVFVAWADGAIDDRERDAIIHAARNQGLVAEEMAQTLLHDWLEKQPEPGMLELWKGYVRRIWTHFTADERWQMRQTLLEAAESVAQAAGGFLGLAKISAAEQAVLDELAKTVD